LADLDGMIEIFKATPREVGSHVDAETLKDFLDRPPRQIVEFRQVAIPYELPLRIGEFAYNLRSALDYLIFALAWHDTGREPTDDWARHLQFPIESDPQRFTGRRNTMLEGISDPHVAMIREYQPAHGCNWTAVLAGLNDSDKHRHLTVLLGGDIYAPESNTAWFDIPCIHPGAEPDAEGRYEYGTQMHVDTYASLDVVFPDGSLVSETLEELETEVGSLLQRFGREFTLWPV